MVFHVLYAETPDDVVVELLDIQLGFAVLSVAIAVVGKRFATAIAIGDQIGLAIIGIDAGANPRYRRWLGARRA